MTQVSIVGTEIHLDGQPTYPGHEFEGHPVQGLLFNVRAVHATFDDANWTINIPFKWAFFTRVAEITG